MDKALSPSTIVVASTNQVSCDLSGEAAILSLANNVYYSVNSVGARVWDLVQQPIMIARVRDSLLSEFDVAADVLDRDLQRFLDALRLEGLIELRS